MSIILTQAQGLVYTLVSLMPSLYQQQSLQALLGLFLEAQGHPLPQHSRSKSASALSRFLNQYTWSTRALIRAVRQAVLKQILAPRQKGRRATLEVILDLTTLEKTGKFGGLGNLVRVYNGKRGLHLVILYLVVGQWQVPWSFRVYRGKGHPGHVQLGLRLLRTLPKHLTQHFQILVLADTGFGSIELMQEVRRLKFHAVVGVRHDRRLATGGTLRQISRRGQQVWLKGVSFPVTLSWYWLDNQAKRERRFVVSTKSYTAAYITRLGRRRWQIEAFFKTAKHRFGLHRFGQGTLLGVYRWLILSMVAYLLAHWAHLWSGGGAFPDWGAVSHLALHTLLPQLVMLLLLLQLKPLHSLAAQQGLKFSVTGCDRAC
jgi:hypothetical protein